MQMSRRNHYIKFKFYTCRSLQSALYDLECKDRFKRKFIISISKWRDIYVIRTKDNQLKHIKKSQYIEKMNEYQQIIRLKLKDDKVWVYIKKIKDLEDPVNVWSVVSSHYKHFYLKEHDIIKLGSVYLKVRQIRHQQQKIIQTKKTKINRSLEKYYFKNEQQRASKEDLCRICYQEEMDKTDPMIRCCKGCEGTLKWVHWSCIKNWLNQKVQIFQKRNVIEYKYENVECEVCLTHYFDQVKINDDIFGLFDLVFEQQITQDYMVIEQLPVNSDQQKYKVFYLLDMSQKGEQIVNFGKSMENEVIIRDQTLNRVHCSISYDSKYKQYAIRDNMSKYGTLVLQQDSQLLPNRDGGVGYYLSNEMIFSFHQQQDSQAVHKKVKTE